MTRYANSVEDRVRVALKHRIDTNEGTSFVQMEQVFRECGYHYVGDRTIRLPENDGVFLWYGWSEDACRLVFSLLEDGYAVVSCHPVVYLVDGAIPEDVEIARSVKRRYAKPRWLPCVWVKDEVIANGK